MARFTAPFTEHEVVPDVLSVAPPTLAEVEWPSGAKAELGYLAV